MPQPIKNNKVRAVLLWLLVAAWMLFIFVLSAQSSFPVSLSQSGYDVVSSFAHLGLYLILAVLVVEAAAASNIDRRRSLLLALLLCGLYGLFDEYHQSFVPGREMGLSDWLLDISAAFVVVVFYSLLYRIKLIDR